MSDVEFVIGVASKLEAFLRDKMKAEGKGLGEKVKSIEFKLPRGTVSKILRLSTIRNRFAHGRQTKFEGEDRAAFEKLGNDIEEDFERLSHISNEAVVTSGDPEIGPFFFIVNKESEKCLDVADWGTGDGQRIQIWSCNGADNQMWHLHRVEENSFHIISKHSGKCLDVSGGVTDDGVHIQQWSITSWNNGDNQKWSLIDLGDGSYRVKAKISDKCLDVSWETRFEDGGDIIQWHSHEEDNQKWYFHLVAE